MNKKLEEILEEYFSKEIDHTKHNRPCFTEEKVLPKYICKETIIELMKMAYSEGYEDKGLQFLNVQIEEVNKLRSELEELKKYSCEYCGGTKYIEKIKNLRKEKPDFGGTGGRIYMSGYNDAIKKVLEELEDD